VNVRRDRITRVQARMRDEGMVAIVIVNHDDYRYLFGEDRVQPRAVVPAEGPPTIIAFTGEEPEIRAGLEAGAEGEVLVFREAGRRLGEASVESNASLGKRTLAAAPPELVSSRPRPVLH